MVISTHSFRSSSLDLWNNWVLVRGVYLMFISIRNGYFGFNIYTVSNAVLVIFVAIVIFQPFSALLTAPYFYWNGFSVTALGEIYLELN